jgi:hypothetical protein
MFSGESAAAPGAPRPSTTGGFCFGLLNCISERSARLRALHAHRRGHGCPRNVVGFIRHTFPSAWPLKGEKFLSSRISASGTGSRSHLCIFFKPVWQSDCRRMA